jgi:outer membrane protein OmpA-like peptidoglycan-associated protein
MRGLIVGPLRWEWPVRSAALLLGVLGLLAVSPARADHDPFVRGIDAVPVKPTAAQESGLALEGARAAPDGSFRAALLLDFNVGILNLKLGEDKLGNLLPYRLDAHALFAYQLHRRLELALDVPFTVVQGDNFGLLRDALNAPDFPGAAGVRRYGLGDIRLVPRATLLAPEDFPVGVALVGEVRLPTGDETSFLGERGVVVAPRVALERAFGPVRVLANVGWRFRRHAQYLNLLVDEELTLGAGAVLDLPDVGGLSEVQALGEMHLSTPGDAPFNFRDADSLKSPWEVLVGARARVAGPWGVQLAIGRGVGLESGYGREAFRAMLTVRYEETFQDSDYDNVPDAADKCPNEDEDRDGFQDGDGCIDPDNDGDGVVDGKDPCPDKAGPKEYDGCPDSDEDEIPDNVDLCPEKPGPAEYDGCPVDEPPYVIVESDRIRIKGNIQFESGAATIQKQSLKLLDEVADVLRKNPTLGPVLIEGHTDNRGSRAFNVDLSQRRARAVMDYLISKGIERKRLSAKGFGFAQPIATNDTALGRAKNRRVDFRLIKSEVETAPRERPAPAEKGKPEEKK